MASETSSPSRRTRVPAGAGDELDPGALRRSRRRARGPGSAAPPRRARPRGPRRGTSLRCRCRGSPRRAASARATVDLPAPEGPSIATMTGPGARAGLKASSRAAGGPRPPRRRAAGTRRESAPSSRIGPMATRLSFETGCPIISNIRRICRVRPSVSVTRSHVLPSVSPLRGVPETRSIRQGFMGRPSSRSPPRRNFSSCVSDGSPETLTMYSLAQPVEGCVTSRASSPSSVRSSSPSVMTSRRPTGLTDFRRRVRQQIEHRVAALGIRDRRDEALGLVEKDVRLRPGRRPDALLVDLDRVRLGVRALAQRRHLPVDAHAALADPLLGFAPRGGAGGRR